MDNFVMDAIRFNAIIGDDQVIRPPDGVSLPPGSFQVTVVPLQTSPEINELRAFLLAAAAEAERDPTPLPADLAENHDFYAHGKPRG
jgi:hypothetical protein